jgi:hypothetical protein
MPTCGLFGLSLAYSEDLVWEKLAEFLKACVYLSACRYKVSLQFEPFRTWPSNGLCLE